MQHRKKILLVEDDTALAAVYRSRLELEGFEIREVHNGEDALSATVAFRPDLIVLDAMMPKISGFDVLDILRDQRAGDHADGTQSAKRPRAGGGAGRRRIPRQVTGGDWRCGSASEASFGHVAVV